MIGITYRFLVLCAIYSLRSECLKCYECSEYIPCGQGQADVMVDCAGKCMVYLNQFDSSECGGNDREWMEENECV